MIEYKTVSLETCEEFTEKRSRFLGYVKPVDTEDQAAAFIQQIKSKHWDATHNVYAYCLRDGQVQRYSDDGEPQGTAGIPTLNVLLKSEVTDVVVVTTRYFGGILLGGGGLVRAYSHAASIALEKARILTMRECVLAELTCDYNQYGRVSALIPESGGTIDDTAFTDFVQIQFHIAEPDLTFFEKQLADVTCGQVTVSSTGKKFFAV